MCVLFAKEIKYENVKITARIFNGRRRATGEGLGIGMEGLE